MTRRPRPAWLLVGVWLALASAQAIRIAASGSLMSGDAIYHFAHLHSLVVDGDLDPVNEIRYFERARSPLTGRPKLDDRTTRHPQTREVVNKYPIGLAMLTMPAYATVYAGSRLLAAAGVPVDVSGYGWPYQYGCGLLIAAYAVAGLWCCQRVASAGTAPETDAWWATLLVAGATPWLFYTTLEPLFSHALSAAVAAALTWQWLRARRTDTARGWFVTGLIGGLGAIVRYQDATLLLLPALDVATRGGRAPVERLAAGTALIAGAVLAASPQLCVNYLRYGDPLTTGYFGESFTMWLAPRLLFTLTSAEVGLLRWSPLIAVALMGLVAGACRGWPQARLGLVTVAVQLFLVASWYFVSQGHSFGNRMLVNCTVFFVVGLTSALAFARGHGRLRAAMLAIGLALVIVNVSLMWLWSQGAIGPLRELMSPASQPVV